MRGGSSINTLKSQKGSILVELVMVCMVLCTITLGMCDIFNLIRADIYLHKVVREGAREAAITESVGSGKNMADDVANQYFRSHKPEVPEPYHSNYDSEGKPTNVVCEAFYNYKHFSFLGKGGIGGTELNARAIYPWWDEVRSE